MHIKLARCIQTDSRRRNRTQEEEVDVVYAVVHNLFLLSVAAEEQNILP